MNKLHKVFSVVLTAAIAVSLLVVSGVAPVSADNNLWSQVVTPSKTNQVMANNIIGSGVLTQAMNGDLYAFVRIAGPYTAPDAGYRLAKSTTGGRAWTYVATPDQTQAISQIFCSKSEANVVYFSQGNTLYKSIDSGATFTTRGTTPGVAGEVITAISASLVGGSYKVMVGTTAPAFAGNTYFQDEGQFFLSFTPFGTWAGRGNVLDIKLSPNFAVDQGIVALSTTGGNANVSFSTGGGVWGANLQSVTIPNGVTTMGEIGLPSDFTASAAIFFVGVNGATGGLYRVTGSTAAVLPTLLTSGTTYTPVATVDVVGAFATASIIVGGPTGVTQYSTNSGQTWTTGLKQTTGGMAWVGLKSDYATSLTAYVLEAPTTGANDESGFFMSTDSGKDWNGIALLNSTIFDINNNQLAIASNSDMFMITSNSSTTTPDTFKLTSAAVNPGFFAGDTFTLTSAATLGFFVGDTFTISTVLGATGPTAINVTLGNATVTGPGVTDAANVVSIPAGATATFLATTADPIAWTTTAIDLVVTKTVDGNNSMTVFGSGLAAGGATGVDLNPVVTTVTGAASGSFTFTFAGQVSTPFTATVAGNTSWTPTLGANSPTATVTSDANNSTVGLAPPSGSLFGLDLNPVVATILGLVSPTNTFAFTAALQDSTVFSVTAAGSVTWTATAGAGLPTGTKVSDPNNSATVGAGTITGLDLNIGGGTHSLWRNFGGNWERVIGNVASANLNMIAVSPNYITDKGVFFVDNNNIINYSVNNGNTFSKQSVAAILGAGNFTAYQVIDLNTFVVATPSGIMRTTNNGFIWTTANAAVVNMFARSSDGTTMAAYVPATGAIITSSNLGATWTTASTDVAQLMLGVNAIAFQNGSNSVIWAVTNAGLFSIDLSATTVTWSVSASSAVGAVNTLDSAIFPGVGGTGVAVASGIAPTGNTITYALNGATGNVARDLSGTPKVSGNIAQGTLFATASAMFIQPAVGANKLTVIADANKIFTFTDQLAAAVAGVTATGTTGANPTSTAVVSWTALTGADRYSVALVAGSTAVVDPYANAFAAASVNGTTTTLTGLLTNTTYTVSVWAVRTSATGNATMVSFAGTKTFTTQPAEVSVPINLAPAAGATGIAITPGLAWGAVPGATSYTVELSTVNTFATLVGTKQTTTIPAFAWTTPALAYSTTYYWRVVAITATGSSDPVVSVFTTMAAPTTAPGGGGGGSGVTTTSTVVTVTNASTETPGYVWAIIGIGALLVILIVVLTVRTRRVI